MLNPYEHINWTNIVRVPALTHEHCVVQQTVNNMESGGIRFIAVSNYFPAKPVYPLSDYYTVDNDVLSAPNAEHRDTTLGAKAHFNSVGSTFESGAPRGDPVTQTTWQVLFANILNNLQYPAGGGVQINHPNWSGHTVETVKQMLDYDDRVLGIEIYNQSCEDLEGNGWSLDIWDDVLKSGRRCWGFAVPDHGAETSVSFHGRIILLVDTFTEENALIAIRNGAFYAQINNTGLSFTNINLTGNLLTVEADGAEHIEVTVDGESSTYNGETATTTIKNNAVYLRVKAYNGSDMIFSNPIMLGGNNEQTNNINFIQLFADI